MDRPLSSSIGGRPLSSAVSADRFKFWQSSGVVWRLYLELVELGDVKDVAAVEAVLIGDHVGCRADVVEAVLGEARLSAPGNTRPKVSRRAILGFDHGLER